jgi:hypothetical protein
MIIKNKSHKQVTDVIDKVQEKKKTPEWGAQELGLSKHAFDELYTDVVKHMLIM